MRMLKISFWVAVLFTVTLVSCKEDEEPKPNVTIVANAGPDKKIQPGATVTLDGSQSKADRGTLTYQWTVIEKPVNSNPVISSPTDESPDFTADLVGAYKVKLNVSNEFGSAEDETIITVEYTPVVLSNITQRTVLEDRISDPSIPDYVTTGDMFIDAELILKPGVVVAFEEDASVYINDGGSLSVKGEENRKITLRGKANAAGYWRGILVYSNSNANEFEHAEILNAGSDVMVSGVAAAITVADRARIAIRNTRIAGSGGYGIHFMEGSNIKDFGTNVISHNAQAPVLLMPVHVAKLDAASSFSEGNGTNAIEVTGASLEGTSAVTWQAFEDGTPYRFTGTVALQTGLKLTPGVTIEVVENEYFEIGDGYLLAEGTPENKITITGVNKTQSSWLGLIYYSRNQSNILRYVEVSYAGSDEIISGAKSAITITHDASLMIENSTISHSGGYGIYVNGDQSGINADAETVNTFTGNALDPVYYQP
jgi:hypothetical protein